MNVLGDTLLQGLTIVNGYTTNDYYGGGVYASDSDLRIVSCSLTNNRQRMIFPPGGAGYGGGLYAAYCTLSVSNALFACNSASGSGNGWGMGGGIYGNYCAGSIIGVSVLSNRAAEEGSGAQYPYGGGLAFENSTMLIRNTLVTRNWCDRNDGGLARFAQGVYVNGGAASLENCTIVTNCGSAYGTTNTGEGLRVAGSAAVAMTNCIVWGHVTDVTGGVNLAFCDIGSGLSNAVNGTKSADPLFMGADTNNYRLNLGSPCINTGTNLSWMTNAVDLDGTARIWNVRVDMGAYEKFIALTITNLPATNVVSGGGNLNGNLSSDGNGGAHVYLYWGPVDGTNNKSLWMHTNDFGVCGIGPLTTNVTFDNGYGVFYYRYYATNASGEEAWAPVSESVSLLNVWVEVPAPNASEAGPDSGTFRFARPLDATNAPITIYYTLGGTASNGIDYDLLPGSALMAAGQSNVTVTVNPRIDHLVEGNESVVLAIGGGGYVIGTPSTGTVTIADWVPPSLTYVSLGGGNGYATNWAGALTNLQEALNATTATGTNVIYLGTGTYTIASQLLWSNSNVSIAGGYDGTGTPGSPETAPSIIRITNSASRVFFISGVTNGMLKGVTIQGGYQNPGNGGGLYLTNCQNFTIADCIIRSNTCFGNVTYGGGLFATNATLLVTNTQFSANTANGVTPNGAGYGGGLSFFGAALTAIDCRVVANQAIGTDGNGDAMGAGIHVGGGTNLFRNCLVVQNQPTAARYMRGSGLYSGGGSSSVENCTIAGNWGEGVRQAAGTITIRDSILRSHSVSDVVGVPTNAVMNSYIANGDRAFANVNGNLSGDSGMERGLYLAPGSPCINAGSRSVVAAGLSGTTTRADGSPDSVDPVDLGYHWTNGIAAAVADLYVSPSTGSDTNNGSSWGQSLKTISGAAGRAQDGTRIHLSSETYKTNSGEVFPIVLNKLGLQLLGTNAATTVINAVGAGRQVLSLQGVIGDGRIEGVTICGGTSTGYYGGGIYAAACDLTVSACTLSNNIAKNTIAQGAGYGGGLYATYCTVVISNSLFSGNKASGNGNGWGLGGGLYMGYSLGTLLNCTIRTNCAAEEGTGQTPYGGGLAFENSTTVMRNVLVARNWCDRNDVASPARYGHGIYVNGGSASIENCTLATNCGSFFGTTNTGEGLRITAATVALTNCIVWGHVMDVTGGVNLAYCDIGSGLSNGVNGNISVDPQFVSVASNNFHLLRNSPCQDMGTNLPWMVGAKDLDGASRINNRRVDLGAYETFVPASGTSFLFR